MREYLVEEGLRPSNRVAQTWRGALKLDRLYIYIYMCMYICTLLVIVLKSSAT